MNTPDQLIDGYIDGTLDDAGFAALCDWLREDDANRHKFTRALSLHSGIADWVDERSGGLLMPELTANDSSGSGVDWVEAVAALSDDSDVEPIDFTAEKNRREMKSKAQSRRVRRQALKQRALAGQQQSVVISKLAVVLAAAAVLGLIAWLGWPDTQPTASSDLTAQQGDPDVPNTLAPATNVAFIRSSVDARWVGLAYDHNHYLHSGKTVTLREGLAEVVFGDGAAVIIQGPATFEPTGPNAMRLDTGRIVAAIPVSAHGFTVATPGGLVTDYGTEFGVHVNTDGQTLAQTFSGRIGLTPKHGGEEVQLLAGDAVVATPHGQVREVVAEELAFISRDEFQAQRDAGTSAYARWASYSYELRRDPDVVAYYVFDGQDVERGVLMNRAQSGDAADGQLGNGDEIAQPRWVEGRFPQSRALRFGQASGGRTYGVVVPDSDALDLDGEMTFALWVRAAEPQALAGTLLSKRDVPPSRMNYQVSIMADWVDGGRELQLGSGRDDDAMAGFAYSPATGRLAEPGWHHIAITTGGTQVRYYLDGELVHTADQPLPALTNDADLLIGTSPAALVPPLASGADPFHGDISEILIAKRAFNEAEIQALYDNSRATP